MKYKGYNIEFSNRNGRYNVYQPNKEEPESPFWMCAVLDENAAKKVIDKILDSEVEFHNSELDYDIEKLKDFDPPITVAKSEEPTFDYPHALDVEDHSYWYANVSDRDDDYDALKKVIPKFTYV